MHSWGPDALWLTKPCHTVGVQCSRGQAEAIEQRLLIGEGATGGHSAVLLRLTYRCWISLEGCHGRTVGQIAERALVPRVRTAAGRTRSR